ncbi:MAG: phenylalanine--tRNA ligase subunit beta [Oscillospiraceae bacterium]|nr:phenylalanine--tRNA ligase subunit beta [Oscillospiraceae bacterium]
MKVSLNWIKDYVTIPPELELSRLVTDLTMATVEVEDATELASKYENMVVGTIVEILPHPNADKLKICMTDIGGGDIRKIVCGGINMATGMKVAVARPGAMVRWHGEGDLVAIGNAKVRGEESYGMICASSEIGLFDLFPYTDEATILDLSAFDAQAGTSLAQALGLDDIILEIDNKSLTNRPDLWGHYGIAREISALFDLPLSEFKPYPPPGVPSLGVELADTTRCFRYIGVKIEGLSIKPSPFEVQSRIWRVGMRPINAIVDITNYVMLATGQPLHAFDSDRVNGHITVRRAQESENFLMLNGIELSLCNEDLVIADDIEPIGLAGVKGGEKDSVLPDTQKVILEIANFEAIGIRRTSARYETRTEAASRNEKGIDPQRCDIALSLAMSMFAEMFDKMAVTGYSDNYPVPLERKKIDVSLDWLEKNLGKRIPDDEISRMLARLGFDVSIDGDAMRVVVPTWRSTGDVSIPNDIIEEVARMHGFDRFDATSITATFEGSINQPKIDIDRKLREYLATRCGMNEIYTYPWVLDAYMNAVLPDADSVLSISTPPSPDERYLRPSLIPNLCKAVSDNLRYYDEFKIFESAQVFSSRSFSAEYDKRESLPLQRRNVAGACVGGAESYGVLYREAKGILETLPRFTHIEPYSFDRIIKPAWADSVIWQNIVLDGTVIGSLGLLSKKASLDCGIKNSAVMLFELDIDALTPYPSRTNKFERLAEYPHTDYDISMLFDLNVRWEEIYNSIIGKKSPDDLLRHVSFVDEYRGRQVPAGKKSITIRLVIGSLKKTLTSDEIEGCANAIVKRLTKTLGADLRSTASPAQGREQEPNQASL